MNRSIATSPLKAGSVMEDSRDSAITDDARWQMWWDMAAGEGHDHREATAFAIQRTFAGVPLENRSVLEIGSGKGLLAFYVALSGASRVVSMEPQLDGARSTAIETQQRRVAQLGIDNFEILTEDFNTWDAGGERFDVILSFASINHVYESPFHAKTHQATRTRYLESARKIRSMLNPGGVAVIQDACRYGFFWFTKGLGIRRPWTNKRTTINWRIHQNPQTWAGIFQEAGFSSTEIVYPLPYRLRMMGPIVSNPMTNFFLESSFTLRCSAG